jgi:hypothetical protein
MAGISMGRSPFKIFFWPSFRSIWGNSSMEKLENRALPGASEVAAPSSARAKPAAPCAEVNGSLAGFDMVTVFFRLEAVSSKKWLHDVQVCSSNDPNGPTSHEIV